MNTKREARSPLFAERSYHLRCSGNWTLDALGKVVGVSGPMIHHWEKERAYPKPAQIKKLAAALGISVAFLTEVRDAVRLKKEFADDFA